jgi:hypothetical protein
MKEPPKSPPKIKVVVKPPIGTARKINIKEEPINQNKEQPKRKKGLIRKILDIVSNDIRNLPNRLWGAKKKVNMPKSDETYKDWEGQL